MAIWWKFSTTMFGCNFNDFNDLSQWPLALTWALPLLIYLRAAVANALVAIVCAAVTVTVTFVMMMTTTIVPYCWFLRWFCCRPSLPPSSVRLLSNQFNVCSVIKLLQINSTHWYRSARTRQAACQPASWIQIDGTMPIRNCAIAIINEYILLRIANTYRSFFQSILFCFITVKNNKNQTWIDGFVCFFSFFFISLYFWFFGW